jgi:hypothetical protein
MQPDPQLLDSLTPARIATAALWLAAGAVVGAIAANVARWFVIGIALFLDRFRIVQREDLRSIDKNCAPRILSFTMLLAGSFGGLLMSHFQSVIGLVYLLCGTTVFLMANMLLI